MFDHAFRAFANKNGSARWGEKTPEYALGMQQIQRMWPDAKFIHVIRDGRDVALSLKKVNFIAPKDLKSDGRMTEESCGSLILLKFAFPFSFRSINLILHQISLKPLLESKQTPWMPRFCISSIQTD